jgi:hypothetical protein
MFTAEHSNEFGLEQNEFPIEEARTFQIAAAATYSALSWSRTNALSGESGVTAWTIDPVPPDPLKKPNARLPAITSPITSMRTNNHGRFLITLSKLIHARQTNYEIGTPKGMKVTGDEMLAGMSGSGVELEIRVQAEEKQSPVEVAHPGHK